MAPLSDRNFVFIPVKASANAEATLIPLRKKRFNQRLSEQVKELEQAIRDKERLLDKKQAETSDL